MPPLEDPAPVPRPPARTASREQIEHGQAIWPICGHCHGSEAIGVGPRAVVGAVPDLRYMTAQSHAEWDAIVLGGSLKLAGMPGFHEEISAEDSEAVRAYLIEQAWALYEGSQRGLD